MLTLYLCFFILNRHPQIVTKFGQGDRNALITNVRCTGTEKTFSDCPFDWIGTQTCPRHAGIICSKIIITIFYEYIVVKVILKF